MQSKKTIVSPKILYILISNSQVMTHEYNTQKTALILKEYGRNVQKLVEYIASLPNKEERTRYAHTLIGLMKQLNPSVREHNDNAQRIWDHLYLMSDFELDINGPYPVPETSIFHKKPKRMRYSIGEITYKHYGRNVEILIKKAINIADKDEQQQAVVFIFKLMRSFYAAWNKETVDDEIITKHLKELSRGELSVDLRAVRSDYSDRSRDKDRDRGGDRDRDRNRSNHNNSNNKKRTPNNNSNNSNNNKDRRRK